MTELNLELMQVLPDDVIILDLLIYTTDDEAEIESWELIKKTLKELAHTRVQMEGLL